MLKTILTKNMFLGAVLPVLLIAIGVGLLYGLEGVQPKQIEPPSWDAKGLMPFMPIAEVAKVKPLSEKSPTLDLEVNGTVVPYREIELAAEAAGRIIHKAANVRSGNYVQSGQLLYRIDPRDYQLEISRLTRKRDQELASVRELDLDIENSKLLLEVAEEELQLASEEVKRLESLSRNFSSAAELDQAKRSRLTSLNQRVNIQNQIRAQQSRRSRLELAAKLAETELEQAQLNLLRTEITSPVDGRIVSDQVEADSYVQKGTPLVVIEDTSKLEVACNIRMDQLYWILDQSPVSAEHIVNAAQAARYELPPTEVEIRYQVAGRESFTCIWQGVLDRIDGVGLDPQSRTVPIRIRVNHPEQVVTESERAVESGSPPMLVRGMYVQATIKSKPATNLWLVPKLSIKPASGASTIWKFKPDRQAMYETPIALKTKADAEAESVNSGKPDEGRRVHNAKQQLNQGQQENDFDPNNWIGGFLVIVKDVRVVRDYWDTSESIDYWVCEVPNSQLSPSDFVVVTPLPHLKEDDRDPIRVAKTAATAEAVQLAGSVGSESQL